MKKATILFFLLITVVDTEIETEPEKEYSITRESSVSFLSIVFVGDQ